MRQFLCGFLCLIVGFACGGPSTDADATAQAAPATEAVHEGLRVVAVAPSAVEQLFALGLGDQVVGVGDFATWPEAVKALPRLGGLYDFRLERIVELEPDLAVLVTSEQGLRQRLVELGIEVLVLPNESLADIDVAMRAIADRFDLGKRGEEAIGRWWSMLEPRPQAGRGAEVMVTVGREPGALDSLIVAGQRTFLDELVQRLGAVNAFADSAARYPQVGLDVVLQRAPSIVLELRAEPLTDEARARAEGDWSRIDAGWASGLCVVSIEGSHTLLAGPRVPQLYNEMARALAECGGR